MSQLQGNKHIRIALINYLKESGNDSLYEYNVFKMYFVSISFVNVFICDMIKVGYCKEIGYKKNCSEDHW